MLDSYTNKGNSLLQMSDSNQLMLVFLRHFGCNFCRETLRYLSESKQEIQSKGYKIILIHQSSKSYAEQMLEIYDLGDLEHISDKSLLLYRSFEINTLKVRDYFNPAVFFGFFRSLFNGDFPGRIQGDPNQKPGIFLFYKRSIVGKFEYRHIAQRPDLIQLATQSI